MEALRDQLLKGRVLVKRWQLKSRGRGARRAASRPAQQSCTVGRSVDSSIRIRGNVLLSIDSLGASSPVGPPRRRPQPRCVGGSTTAEGL